MYIYICNQVICNQNRHPKEIYLRCVRVLLLCKLMRTVGVAYPGINIYTIFSTKRNGNMVAIVLFYVDLSTNLVLTHCLYVFSICIYTVITLLINCPMLGEFLSNALIEMNVRVKAFLKVKKMYFQKQSKKILVRNFSKFTVTEIKIF